MRTVEDFLALVGFTVVVIGAVAVTVFLGMIVSSMGFGDEHKELDRHSEFEIEIGEQRTIDFVKHVEEKEYELGFVNEDGELLWETMTTDIEKMQVKYDKDATETTLTKHENKTFWFMVNHENYTLTIGKKGVEGGEIERSCGKNCTEEIQTEILN